MDNSHDPRTVLSRDKYFSLRPQPLEQWIWRQGIAPSAERVFWLHWQAGMRNADWYSEIPIRTVAQQCSLDVSTVTRAYQLLSGLGLIRRVDPGRDPANPFQQAVALTEVRVPRELLVELDRYPNRPRQSAGRQTPVPEAQTPTVPANVTASVGPSDPFPGFSIRQRLRALSDLTALMSAQERHQFDQCQRLHTGVMEFDASSRLDAPQRATVLQWLQICARRTATVVEASALKAQPTSSESRKLSPLQLAHLRRELQSVLGTTQVVERLREAVWSIEEGALRRFQPLHAIRIALKKIREGAWSRPNRMPPQWRRLDAAPEPCRVA